MQNTKKGFTLIELLIVIGILAILVAAVVVVLNPAQLLAQARDGQRMSDLDSLRSAINLDLATVSSPAVPASSTLTASGTAQPAWTGITYSSNTAVTGAGWVAINFSLVSGGSPLAQLPIDPSNTGAYFYGFHGSSTASTFKLITRLESAKYAPKMATDGGSLSSCNTDPTTASSTCFYEVGSDVINL